jgi:hypothetical protein
MRRRQSNGDKPARSPLAIPFVRGSQQVYEGPFVDISNATGASSVARGPFDIPARGFLRHVIIQVDCSGGALGGGTLTEDYPYNLLGSVQLLDPGGTPIYGPTSGYSLYIANLLGGYAFESDVAVQPDFVGTINASYFIRVPVEITSHDAFGSLLNENANAAYKLSFTQPATTEIVTGGAPTAPTVRYRAWLAAWADPPEQDAFGNPLPQEPPGHGTIQYWTEQTFTPPAAFQMVKLTRVGNPLRVLALILRVSGARSTANIPDPITFAQDARQVVQLSRGVVRGLSFERYGRAMPTGVVAFDFISDGEGHAGNEARNLYDITFNGTRLEIGGTWGGAGTLTVLTNDLAPVGQPVRPREV